MTCSHWLQKGLILAILLFPKLAFAMMMGGLDPSHYSSPSRPKNGCEALLEGHYQWVSTLEQFAMAHFYPTPFGNVSIARYSEKLRRGPSAKRYFVALSVYPGSFESFRDFKIDGMNFWMWVLEAARMDFAESNQFKEYQFGDVQIIEAEDKTIFAMEVQAQRGAGIISDKVVQDVSRFAGLLVPQVAKRMVRRHIEDLSFQWNSELSESQFYFLFKFYFSDYVTQLSPVDYLIFMTHVLANNRSQVELFFGDLKLKSANEIDQRGNELVLRFLEILSDDPQNHWQEIENVRGEFQRSQSGEKVQKTTVRHWGSPSMRELKFNQSEPSEWKVPVIAESPQLMKALAEQGYTTVTDWASSLEEEMVAYHSGLEGFYNDLSDVDPGHFVADGIEFLGLPYTLERDLKNHGIFYVSDLLALTIDDLVGRFGWVASENLMLVLEANGYDLYVDPRPTRWKINPNRLLRKDNIEKHFGK